MRACDPMLYGGMWYMTSENQSCFSRWAVFERCAIYHTFGIFVTSELWPISHILNMSCSHMIGILCK